MTPALSVIIITFNEEADLPGCLESLRGLEEQVIIADGGSTDHTMEIARSFTPHVFAHAFLDYASQKQAALDHATGRWVLSIDADERLTPALREEIRSHVGTQGKSAAEEAPLKGLAAYDIPFQVYFMGRRLRFGGLGSERHLRLFRRDLGRFVGGKLHEGVSVQGPVGHLAGAMEHIPYRDTDEYFRKLELYTTYAAQKRLAEGRRFSMLCHLLPFWEFFARTVLKLGFLDGTPGIVWAGLSAFHTWVKYVKLWEMTRRDHV